MSHRLVIFLVILILTSCSTPRYTYFFDRHQDTTGKSSGTESKSEFLLPPDQVLLTASAFTEGEVLPMHGAPELESREIEKGLSVTERKEKRAPLLQIKAKTRMSIPRPPPPMLGRDLKLSIIFGGSGIVGLIIGGSFFLVVGSISLLIGVILLVKWLVRNS